jgi:hypothetical protein
MTFLLRCIFFIYERHGFKWVKIEHLSKLYISNYPPPFNRCRSEAETRRPGRAEPALTEDIP